MIERNRIEDPVALEFKRFNEDFLHSLASTTPMLQSAIDTIMHSSGKHIRPLLVLLTAKMCGQVTDKAINSAVLLELLHTASLIHDDVIDNTRERRGLPSLNAIFDNRVSVLVGDYLLSSALIRSVQTADFRIINVVCEVGRELSEGEIRQLEMVEKMILEERSYLQLIRKKTAMLLAACTQVGALSAGATDEVVGKCRLFGEYFGYSFQIRDDIFDYFDNADIGKPTGNDILDGKITLPLLHALSSVENGKAHYYRQMIENRSITKDTVGELTRFAKENGGIEYAESRMKEYRDKALDILYTFPESEARTGLLLLADYIIERKR
ncbi:MAG: polyprenyl synthetase family protein [Tannerellaceae bacterium]|jgi:octaprenyl-diphosphate synthase|nr:polyprenyl synthetase family protein [Tannerellaceae bacterium]